MVNIAVLLTCFNRKALTLQCLQHLASQQGQENFALDIYLVDDGCSDGTSAAVREQFPGVQLIQGNGELFWNGGMRVAWQEALKTPHDFFLWVNDDITMHADAIQRLLADYHYLLDHNAKPGAIAGTLVDPGQRCPTYGGRTKSSWFNPLQTMLVEPAAQPRRCDYTNGNLVLVPMLAVTQIGILDAVYKHGYGDFDYSQRLQQAGFSCWVASGVLGECVINRHHISSTANKSIRLRVAETRQLERLFPYRNHMHFIRVCGGAFWPLWWLKAWLRGNFPLLWVLITRA